MTDSNDEKFFLEMQRKLYNTSSKGELAFNIYYRCFHNIKIVYSLFIKLYHMIKKKIQMQTFIVNVVVMSSFPLYFTNLCISYYMLYSGCTVAAHSP